MVAAWCSRSGPRPGRGVLVERGVVGAEARYLQLVEQRLHGAPSPRLLHSGADEPPGGSEWLISEFVPGVALTAIEREADQDTVRADLGAAVARLHTITGEHYGYDGGRACGRTWREAYTAVIESLLDDAARWKVSLVVPAERIRAAVARCTDVLDEVERPVLLHFDLWDGNALCAADSNGRWGLTGLVDGERFLFGDPLVDFISRRCFGELRGSRDIRSSSDMLPRPGAR